MDFVAVVFMLALLCFFSFDATVFSVNKDLYITNCVISCFDKNVKYYAYI